MSLTCTFEEFKRMAKEFREAAPTLNFEELQNAFMCLGLGYLNISEPIWQHSAAIVLKMETQTFLRREFELKQMYDAYTST